MLGASSDDVEAQALCLQDIPSSGQKVPQIGDYELIEVIARGGMGVVYKARQRSLNRIVALKLLLGGAHASQDFQRRFRREAETAARLQHPNIVPIYEVGEHDGQPFFSMEYVAGSDLATLTRERPLPARRAAQYVKSIAEAVHFAHQHGILHRDIKPSNILVGPDDRPRITDFGLARQTNAELSLTVSGAILGTPGYLPPEQAGAASDPVGPQSDVYSLGATLYHLFTGRPPFQAATVAVVLRQVLESSPLPPRQMNPALPRDFDTICLRCLEKEPRRRYASALELGEDLGRALRGEPILAQSAGPFERGVKWARRKPAIALLLFTTIVALLSGVTGTTIQWRRAQAESRSNRERLASSYTDRAVQSLEAGSPLEALPWLAEALRLKDTVPQGAAAERLRLDSTLQNCPKLLAVFAHEDGVLDARFSPDGRRVLTAGRDRKACLWDLASGTRLSPPLNHADWVTRAVFSQDGKTVATGCRDGTVRLWDPVTGVQTAPTLSHESRASLYRVESMTGQLGICALAFTSDGTRVLSGGWHPKAMLWDAVRGAVLSPLPHGGEVTSGAISSDDSLLLTGSGDGYVRLWSAADGALLFSARPSPADPQSWAFVNAVAFSPDASRFAAVTYDGWVTACDTRSQSYQLRSCQPRLGSVLSVSFSPDGARLVTGGFSGTTMVWSLAEGRLDLVLQQTQAVTTACFSPDGRHLLTGCGDGAVRLWDSASGKALGPPIRHGAKVTSAGFSPDGSQFLTGSLDGTARVWDTESLLEGGRAAPLQIGASAFAVNFISNTNLFVAGNDRTLQLWDVQTRALVAQPVSVTNLDGLVAANHTGHLVATVGADQLCWVWDLRTGKKCSGPIPNVSRFAAGSAFDSRDARLAICTAQGLLFWDLPGSRPLSVLSNASTRNSVSMSTSPQGDLLALANAEGGSLIFDWNHLEQPPLILPHPDAVWSVAFSRDGHRVATAGNDGNVRIWDAHTGRPLVPPFAHPSPVSRVWFNRRGDLLLSLTQDGVVRAWSAADGSLAYPALTPPGGINQFALSPDDRWIATTGQRLCLWDLAAGRLARYPVAPVKGESFGALDFSPDGTLLAVTARGGPVHLLDLRGNPRPAQEMLDESVLLTHRAIGPSGGVVGIAPQSAPLRRSAAKEARSVSLNWEERALRWHETQAAASSQCSNFAAATFHWEHLARLRTNDPTVRLRLAEVRSRIAKPSSSPPATVDVPGGEGRFVPGYLVQETYRGILGWTVSPLTNHSRFLKEPDRLERVSSFEVGGDIGRESGVRLSGYLRAPDTGQYVFFLANDDEAQLFLSPDANPEHKRLIASNNLSPKSRWWPVLGTNQPGEPLSGSSPPVRLDAGRWYYVEARLKQAGGPAFLAVGWQKPGSPPPKPGDPPIPSQFLGYLDPGVVLRRQPASLTVKEGQTARFAVALGSPDFSKVQWQVDSQDIPGANDCRLETARLRRSDSGAKYRCRITSVTSPGSAISQEAVVTVLPDTAPPKPLHASRYSDDPRIFVQFDEPLDPMTSARPLCYRCSAGEITEVRLELEDRFVVLSTASSIHASGPGLLQVSGLRDWAGNQLSEPQAVNVQTTPWLSKNIRPAGASNGARSFAAPTSDDGFDVLAVSGGFGVTPADDFHFVYQPVIGDFDLSVQLCRFDPVGIIAQAGLMARESLESDAGFLVITANPVEGNNWIGARSIIRREGKRQETPLPDLPSDRLHGVNIPDEWLRIRRSGNALSIYRSRNGTDWTTLWTVQRDLPTQTYVGLCASQNDLTRSLRGLVSFRHLRLAQPVNGERRPGGSAEGHY